MLKANASTCFSSRYVLQNGSSPCGFFEYHGLNEPIRVSLLNRQRLIFNLVDQQLMMLKLEDQKDGETISTSDLASAHTRSRFIDLSVGQCTMDYSGLLMQGYLVEFKGQRIAESYVRGACLNNWRVDVLPGHQLTVIDQLMIGLTTLATTTAMRWQ